MADDPIPTDPAPTPSAKSKKPKRKGWPKWRHRLAWFCGIVLALLFIVRGALPFWFPMALRQLAARYNFDIRYERTEFHLLSGDAALWHVQLIPHGSTDPVLETDYIRGNISTLTLLRGRLDAWRVEADGVQMIVDRSADGSIPLLDQIIKGMPKSNTTKAPTAPLPPSPLNLTPPLTIDAFRLSQIDLVLRDKSVSPPFQTHVTMNFRLSDLASPVRPTKLSIEIWAEHVLDSLRISGVAKNTGQSLDADVELHIYGLRPRSVATYLAALGIRPIGKTITIGATANIHVAATQPTGSASVAMKLTDLHADSDGIEAAGCDSVNIVAPVVNSTEAHVSDIAVENVRLDAARSSQGAMRFLGLEFFTPPSPTTQPTKTAAMPTPPATATTNPAGFQLTVDRLDFKNLSTVFEDAAATPPAKLAMIVDDVSIAPIVIDSRHADQATNFKITMHAPGIAQAISIDGSAQLASQSKSAHVNVAATGLGLTAIETYLKPLGIESTLADARFKATLEANWSMLPNQIKAALSLHDVELADANGSLLALSAATIDGLSLDTNTGGISFDQVQLTGPALIARREATGVLDLLGLRLHPNTVAPVAATNATATPVPTAPTTAAPLPPIAIHSFKWSDIQFQFVDQTVSPEARFDIGNARIEAHDLSLDLSSTKSGPPAQITATIDAPGLIDHGQLDASLHAVPHGLAMDSVEMTANGLNLAKLAPYLKPLGIQPTIATGAFHVHAAGAFTQEASGPQVSVDVSALHLAEAQRELLGLNQLHVDGLSLGTPLTAHAIDIDHPHLFTERESDGTLNIAGMRMVKNTAAMPAAPTASAVVAAVAPTLLPDMPLAIDEFKITDATVDLADHAQGRSVALQAIANVSVDHLKLGSDAPTSSLLLSLRVPGAIDQASLGGQITLKPKLVKADLSVKAVGVKAGPLAAYVPDTLAVDLHNGQLAAKLNATAQIAEPSGLQLAVKVNDVDWRDAAESLLGLKNLTLDVPRFDLTGGVITVDRVSTSGLSMRIKRLASGQIALLGISTKSPPPATSKPAAATETPIAPIVVTTQPSSQDVNAIIAAARKPLPLITLNTLDIGIDRIDVVDEARPTAAPLALRAFHVATAKPISLGGKDSFAHDPIVAKITGSIDPIVGHFAVDATASPFAQEPTAKVDLKLSGINGKGLLRAIPEMAGTVDGSPLSEGQFTTHLETSLHLQRRTPTDFDFAHGFDLDLLLKNCEYRAKPDGPVLLGVEQIESDGVHIDASQSSMIAKTVDIHTPTMRAVLDKAGLHVLGLTILLPNQTPTTGPTTKASETAKAPEPTTVPKVSAAIGPPPKSVIRVDKLLISGIDVNLEDRQSEPAMIIPLNSLDAEVRGLSNQDFYVDQPIDFSVLIGAGKVPLPKRIGGQLDMEQTEDRDLLSQIAVDGHVSLYPQMHGWAKVAVSGFDLLSLCGPASLAGVNVGGGTYDGTVDLRFEEGNKISVRSKHVLTDLSLTEGDNGPIRKALKLPSPLNIVIGLLTDADGAITMPLNFPIDGGKIQGIGPAAVGALADVIATAVASAPIKMAKGVGSMVGIKWGKKKPMSPITLPFATGYTALQPSEVAELATAVKQLKLFPQSVLSLRHDLSAADLALARQRANPSHDDAVNLAHQLRDRKLELLRQRQEMAGAASGVLAILPAYQAAQTVARLQQVDRDIAATEDALDQVYELLRPGADRQADRRTRAAALRIGKERLDAVREALLAAADIPKVADRIHVNNPSYTSADGVAAGQVVISPASASK